MSPDGRKVSPIDAQTSIPVRRVPSVLAVLLCICGLLAADGGRPAVAQSTRSRLEEATRRLEAVQDKLDSARAAYEEQWNKLESIQGKIAGTRQAIQETEGRADELRGELRDRVRNAYRMGGMGFIDFLLSAESLRDFGLRLVILQRQSSSDEDLLLKLERLHGELEAKKRQLDTQREEQAQVTAVWKDRTQDLNSALQSAQAEQAELERQYADELEAARAAAARRRAARATSAASSGGGRVISLQACPAAGPRSFSNDWGAPRGGGRRSHKGNDIFAPNGSPAAAVVSGTIARTSNSGIAGLMMILRGNDGNEYWYIHMSGFAASQGQSVSAGATIAYVGNTGNARGGPAHIHFEIHPGGGGPINPYYSLIKVC